MKLTKEMVMVALDACIDAFIKSINKELCNGEQQGFDLIPSENETEKRAIIAHYVNEFKLRYGPKSRPDLGGKSRGALKRLMQDYTSNQVLTLISTYLKMDDERFKSFGHDLTTLDMNRQKILLRATGNVTRELTNVEKAAMSAGVSMKTATKAELPAGL